MVRLGGLFLLAVASSALLFLAGIIGPAAFAHGVFALGALPLMFGAIAHFVPVLTRSGAPHRALGALPWAVAMAGATALAGVAGWIPRLALAAAAGLVVACAVLMIAWAAGRGRHCLGTPHPGLRWYVAALGLLVLGMAAGIGMVFDPARYPAWRVVHLHLNLLGWIGLTALGTLPVLLPTSVQGTQNTVQAATDAGVDGGRRSGMNRKIDPNAGGRLRTLFWPALAGVVLVAAGAGLRSAGIALAGAGLLVLVPLAHLRAWRALYDNELMAPGATASLVLATLGLLLLLLAGAGHALGAVPGGRLVGSFVFGFLFPLVLGALAQLLPVWRYPGPETGVRIAYHAVLGQHARGRAALCLVAAALYLSGVAMAPVFALIAALHFSFVALARGGRPGRL